MTVRELIKELEKYSGIEVVKLGKENTLRDVNKIVSYNIGMDNKYIVELRS
jgi:hypothetical protein